MSKVSEAADRLHQRAVIVKEEFKQRLTEWSSDTANMPKRYFQLFIDDKRGRPIYLETGSEQLADTEYGEYVDYNPSENPWQSVDLCQMEEIVCRWDEVMSSIADKIDGIIP